MTVTLLHGDCLGILPTLTEQVDAIITDLPYGTTACKWDEIIPFEPMWAQVKRLLKPRGVFVTTASQPFTSRLVMSNYDMFKYEWVWKKNRPTGFANAKKRPLKITEGICVFGGWFYDPQGVKRIDKMVRNSRSTGGKTTGDFNYGEYYLQEFTDYPTDLLCFELNNSIKLHPTQKPVALYEYLIRTYTNEGDTVLDFCAGSGTTGVAAINTGRHAILIEKDAGYFEIIQRRISDAQQQMRLLT